MVLLVTGGNGLPMAAFLTAEQRHESALSTDVIGAGRVPRP